MKTQYFHCRHTAWDKEANRWYFPPVYRQFPYSRRAAEETIKEAFESLTDIPEENKAYTIDDDWMHLSYLTNDRIQHEYHFSLI